MSPLPGNRRRELDGYEDVCGLRNVQDMLRDIQDMLRDVRDMLKEMPEMLMDVPKMLDVHDSLEEYIHEVLFRLLDAQTHLTKYIHRRGKGIDGEPRRQRSRRGRSGKGKEPGKNARSGYRSVDESEVDEHSMSGSETDFSDEYDQYHTRDGRRSVPRSQAARGGRHTPKQQSSSSRSCENSFGDKSHHHQTHDGHRSILHPQAARGAKHTPR